MPTMKELDQTSNCYICGKKCTSARPWAMTSQLLTVSTSTVESASLARLMIAKLSLRY